MRSTFNILFYVNKSKEKNGVVPVMGRVTINGTQSQFSCKKSIPLDMWDVKGNCAKGRSKEALQINRELDNIKAQIIKHYQHLSDREAFVCNIGAFKGHAHRECKPGIGTYQHCDHSDLCQNHKSET